MLAGLSVTGSWRGAAGGKKTLGCHVLMLSGKDRRAGPGDGLGRGGDDYLTKPFSYVVAAGPVLGANCCGGARPPQRRWVLIAGRLSLDPARAG